MASKMKGPKLQQRWHIRSLSLERLGKLSRVNVNVKVLYNSRPLPTTATLIWNRLLYFLSFAQCNKFKFKSWCNPCLWYAYHWCMATRHTYACGHDRRTWIAACSEAGRSVERKNSYYKKVLKCLPNMNSYANLSEEGLCCYSCYTWHFCLPSQICSNDPSLKDKECLFSTVGCIPLNKTPENQGALLFPGLQAFLLALNRILAFLHQMFKSHLRLHKSFSLLPNEVKKSHLKACASSRTRASQKTATTWRANFLPEESFVRSIQNWPNRIDHTIESKMIAVYASRQLLSLECNTRRNLSPRRILHVLPQVKLSAPGGFGPCKYLKDFLIWPFGPCHDFCGFLSHRHWSNRYSRCDADSSQRAGAVTALGLWLLSHPVNTILGSAYGL